MPRRLRLACGGNTEQLRGIAGMDETCIGGKEANKRKNKQTPGTQGGNGKQTVIGMRERGGRAKAESIAKTDIAAMNREIGEAAEFGATIHTDDHPAYNRLHTACQHGTVNHSAKAYVNGLARANGIESVWTALKRGCNGAHHNWSDKHMQRHINEFAFRLKEGSCQRHALGRLDSLIRGAIGKRIACADSIN